MLGSPACSLPELPSSTLARLVLRLSVSAPSTTTPSRWTSSVPFRTLLTLLPTTALQSFPSMPSKSTAPLGPIPPTSWAMARSSSPREWHRPPLPPSRTTSTGMPMPSSLTRSSSTPPTAIPPTTTCTSTVRLTGQPTFPQISSTLHRCATTSSQPRSFPPTTMCSRPKSPRSTILSSERPCPMLSTARLWLKA